MDSKAQASIARVQEELDSAKMTADDHFHVAHHRVSDVLRLKSRRKLFEVSILTETEGDERMLNARPASPLTS